MRSIPLRTSPATSLRPTVETAAGATASATLKRPPRTHAGQAGGADGRAGRAGTAWRRHRKRRRSSKLRRRLVRPGQALGRVDVRGVVELLADLLVLPDDELGGVVVPELLPALEADGAAPDRPLARLERVDEGVPV